MIKRQVVGTDLPMAVVANALGDLGAPPVSLAERTGLLTFTPHVYRIWIEIEPIFHTQPLKTKKTAARMQMAAAA